MQEHPHIDFIMKSSVKKGRCRDVSLHTSDVSYSAFTSLTSIKTIKTKFLLPDCSAYHMIDINEVSFSLHEDEGLRIKTNRIWDFSKGISNCLSTKDVSMILYM